jgi:hypothetical protein
MGKKGSTEQKNLVRNFFKKRFSLGLVLSNQYGGEFRARTERKLRLGRACGL